MSEIKKILAGGKTAPGPGHFEIFLIDKPELRDENDVLFRVTSVGMCGTDVSIYKWTDTAARYNPQWPLVTGHEMAGIVEEVGANVTRFKPGDFITVNEHIFCGECEACKQGRTSICNNRYVLGCHVNGAMTRYMVVREQNVFKLPDSIPHYAGSIAEPLAVSIHAIERMPAEKDDLVVVYGAGTIGLGVVLALIDQGIKVICADIVQARLDVAAEFGAIPVNTTTQDIMDAIRAQGKDFADKVYECTGVEPIVKKSFEIVCNCGSICQVGIPGYPIAIEMGAEVAMNEKNIIGTRAFYHSTWDKAIELMARRPEQCTRLVTHRLPLERFPEAIDMMKSGDCIKIVIEP